MGDRDAVGLVPPKPARGLTVMRQKARHFFYYGASLNMSMTLSVYVGPYIEAWKFPHRLILDHESAVADGRGELGAGEDRKYLVPNKRLRGVDRQMTFARDADMSVIEMKAISHEITMFQELAEAFMRAVHDAEGECRITWGIVCGMS